MTKPKRSKKQTLFELWIFFFPFLYLLLLPALFTYYPGAVTAWLDAWHILFGNLPTIAAFLSEAEYMVNKHGLSMPHTYYIHGFWVCFASLSLSLWGLCQVLKANDGWLSGIDKIGFANYHFVFLGTFCIFTLFVLAVFYGWSLDALFEYPDSGRIALIFGNWLGFQYQPLFILSSGFMFIFFTVLTVLNLISYHFKNSRLFRWVKHRGD